MCITNNYKGQQVKGDNSCELKQLEKTVHKRREFILGGF